MRVLYIQYTNPAAYPPVEHGSRMLADSGIDVLLLGTENQGHALRLPAHDRIRLRLMSFQAGGWRQKLHYARFTLWVLIWTLRWRPSWVYASDPLACPVALLLKRLLGARVVYHEHDSPRPDSETSDRTSRFMRMTLKARRALARDAELCILPTNSRAQLFRMTTRRKHVVTVWNCPRRNEVTNPRSVHKEPGLRVWYHGSIVPARVPVTLIEALTRLPETVTLTIAGYETVGNLGYVETLNDAARQYGVEHRVAFLGAIPHRADLLANCRQHDLGLALLPLTTTDVNEREMVGASNKPFDYMSCGLALLVSDIPSWRAMYVEPGYARCCDPGSPESVANALQWFLEHPAELRAIGERGRAQIRDVWNYDRAFLPVLQHIAGAFTEDRHAYEPSRVEGPS
jgi:glycosyltransferase involved in cell wall biosynthesis